MRWLVVFAAAAGLAATGTAGGDVAAKPALELVQSHPLVVRGRDFKPDERVVVLLFARGERWARAVRATDAGGFTARFPVVRPRCGGFVLHALGSRGSRARHVSRLHVYCRPVLPDQGGIDATK